MLIKNMKTIESGFLSLCHFKKITCWILLVIATLCLPVCGQAMVGGTVPSMTPGKIGSVSVGSSIKTTPTFRRSSTQPGTGRGNFLPPPPVSAGSAGGVSYIVGAEDILAIDVYDNPDLKGEYTVSAEGDIVFPLIGKMKASGKNLAEIKGELTRLLEKDYLFNPIVSVDVSKYLSKKVKLMGNVGKPGVYYLDGPTRLFDLLTKAEGVSKQSGATVMSGQKVHIMRAAPKKGSAASPDTITTYYVDLHQLLVEGRDEANVYLQPEDVIFIPDASSFHVIGEVKNPGAFPFEEGITLLKAIALADGLTEKGSSDNALIKRLQNGRVIEIKAGMDTLLAADDTVYIPEDKNFIQVVGEVKRPGSFPYDKGLTLLKAISYAGGATLKGSAENATIKRVSNGRSFEMKGGMDTVLQPDDTVFIPEARSVEVVGEVKNPGSVPYELGMSLLKAINLAGGATLKGSAENAVIKRLSKGRTIEIKGEGDTILQSDDSVFVPEARSVEVVGEVKNPGSIPYEAGMSPLKAINLSGGATLKGSTENAVIKRLSNGRIVEMNANMYTSVQPDDTIFVPEIRSFHVVGEVKQPGSFPHEPRLTLVKAIAMAGGATKKAAQKKSIIKRLKNGKIEEIEATMSTLILPEDVIEVPLSFW
ncbi:hypothetical protein KKHLCK_11975 [Candidatus Electrothrix laxa]